MKRLLSLIIGLAILFTASAMPVYAEEKTLNIPKKALSQYTWDEINQIAASGMASEYFSVYDEISVTLATGEVITLEIADFDHDILASDTNARAPITFMMKNCLATTIPFTSSGKNTGGWETSEMRAKINGELFYDVLPEDLKKYIPEVIKYCDAGYHKAGIVTTVDKCFIPSAEEMCYDRFIELGTLDCSVSGQGTAYESMKHGYSSQRLLKYVGDSKDFAKWATRTCSYYNEREIIVIGSGKIISMPMLATISSQFAVCACFAFGGVESEEELDFSITEEIDIVKPSKSPELEIGEIVITNNMTHTDLTVVSASVETLGSWTLASSNLDFRSPPPNSDLVSITYGENDFSENAEVLLGDTILPGESKTYRFAGRMCGVTHEIDGEPMLSITFSIE